MRVSDVGYRALPTGFALLGCLVFGAVPALAGGASGPLSWSAASPSPAGWPIAAMLGRIYYPVAGGQLDLQINAPQGWGSAGPTVTGADATYSAIGSDATRTLYLVGAAFYMLDPVSGAVATGPAPRGRTRPALAVYRGRLFSVGGLMGTTPSGIVESIDLWNTAAGWTQHAPLGTPRLTSAVVMGDALYAVGGQIAGGGE